MRFELTTFSLARRRSTAELRPHKTHFVLTLGCAPEEMDPVGFEPTISSVQGRRLPARPRAHVGRSPIGADERTRTSTTCRSTAPKSVASAISATSARCWSACRRQMKKVDVPPILLRTRFVRAVICLTPTNRRGDAWLAGCYPASPAITATRSNHRDTCHASLTHSPCSRLHARLAGRISTPAGGLLPHPFSPYQHPGRMPGRWRDYSLLRL